jgi:catechol 2,3-dioxygenase-like lactoylglutathione lyase family enzyme
LDLRLSARTTFALVFCTRQVVQGAVVRIGAIVIHCHEFSRMVDFWSNALSYVPREPAAGGWVVLTDPKRRGPNLSFQQRDNPKETRSWVHLDLYTSDAEKEVVRLLGLGARRYPWRSKGPRDFVVLEDPDGNLFCVVQKDEQ